MKLNTHGVLGILSIFGMIGIAFLKNWSINWIYFGVAITAYSFVVLLMTLSGRDEYYYPTLFLVGCHTALILLAAGMLLNGSAPTFGVFVVCVAVGLAVPRLFLWKQAGRLGINLHGLLGIIALVVIGSLELLTRKTPWYFGTAVILYSAPFILSVLNDISQSGKNQDEPLDSWQIRLTWGWHLSLIFLTGGMFLDIERSSLPIWLTYLTIFTTSIAAGLAIPFLLLRDRLGD